MPVDRNQLGGNRLLAAVDGPLRDQLAAHGDEVALEFKSAWFEEGAPIDRVVFPLEGVISLLSGMQDGSSVEVATVGNEGFVGLPVFLQATLTSSHWAMVQIAGRGIAFSAADFLDVSNANGELQAILQRYAQALISQIAQGAACNRSHSLEQRAARWLLMTHDRVDGDRFPLTQEFLAQMLGVGRQAVNETAQALQAHGTITYTRGVVTVLDRAALERTACECYGVIRSEFDRLIPQAS